jgi:hypothetical protein
MSKTSEPIFNWAQLRALIELTIATILAVLGIMHLVRLDYDEAWVGFALLGTALLFYTLRGRAISSLSVGTNSVAIQMAEEAVQTANQAKLDADIAKTALNQFVAPETAEQAKAEAAPGAWDHPKLKRGKKVGYDPQKNQWGGEPVRNGRQLSAEVERLDEKWFRVVLRVTATAEGAPLVNRVRFHLHDTFRRSIVTREPKSGVAEISRIAWGAFTVGAEVENEPDSYLELDLSKLKGAPRQFREN